MFTGYWLDNTHFLCPAIDKNEPNIVKWIMITTALPRDEDGSIRHDPVSGKYYDLEILESNEFEWKGKKCKICTEEAS